MIGSAIDCRVVKHILWAHEIANTRDLMLVQRYKFQDLHECSSVCVCSFFSLCQTQFYFFFVNIDNSNNFHASMYLKLLIEFNKILTEYTHLNT